MWPSVSSPSMPSPSQTISVTPNASRRIRSMSARSSCGLRFGFSRHCSVVSSAPAPFTSIDPPSSTMPGCAKRGTSSAAAIMPADLPIEVERRILAAPRVVVEIEREPRRVGAGPRDEDRAVVAAPSVVRGEAMERQPLRGRERGEHLANVPLVRRVEHVDVHGLALGERADERSHRRLDAFEHAGPAVAVMRPRKPGRLVRLPFGRHPIAERARPGCGICVQFEPNPRRRRGGRQNGARIILAVS